jgi:hypothetical protein
MSRESTPFFHSRDFGPFRALCASFQACSWIPVSIGAIKIIETQRLFKSPLS